MTDVLPPPPENFEVAVQTLIIGAGACGMVAALAAHQAGQEVMVIEADAVPSGSTALSAGLIPAAGTPQQTGAGISDTPEQFAYDIQDKAKQENDPDLVAALAAGSGPAITWLTQAFDLPFSVVTDFDYPGHSARRMHGLPTRSGRELVDRLRSICEGQGIDIVCERRADVLFAHGLRLVGVEVVRPDGGRERIGCEKLILACNGFGGNREMVTRYMPQIDKGLWFGHDGNRGEAIAWADKLGAATRHLGAYQGHGNVATPYGILITWATITEGGVQINRNGDRFWNEAQGYSEAAQAVLDQPGGDAICLFDERIADVARQFEDYKQAEAQGAVKSAPTPEGIAELFDLPADRVRATMEAIPLQGVDQFGRRFGATPLSPPYCAVRVTGALFHTQGGLDTDGTGRVRHKDGRMFDNLFAAGGAACGVSGSGDTGYLSGNGLLSAVVLGRNAGLAPLD
jgi:fumarate reductase flavoprotein subunit